MSRTSHIANEAIFFQYGSPLTQGMEKAFQDAINFVESIDYSGVTESNWVKHRHTETHQYAKRVLFPTLAKVIKSSINLEITKIIDANSFCGFFAVNLSMDNVEDVLQVLERQTGNTSAPVSLSTSAREVAELYKNLNERTSRLDPSKFGAKLSRPISCKLYMDVDMAFLMNDNLPNRDVQPFTARELTAIYCHEIGHMLSMIQQSGHAYQSFDEITKHLQRLKSSNDINEFVTVYRKNLREQADHLVKAKVIDKKILTVTDAICDNIERIQRTDTSDYVFGTFEFLLTILKNVCIGILLCFMKIFFTVYVLVIVRGLMALCDDPGSQGKTTDQSVNTSVYYHMERMADEYAVRQGYGGDLSSALVKLVNACRYAEALIGPGVSAGSLRTSVVFALYLKFITGLYQFLRIDSHHFGADILPDSLRKSYEDDVARLQRILNDTVAVFKSKLSSEVRDYYLGEYDKTKKALKDMTKPFTQRASDALWNYILEFPTVASRLFQLDDMQELEAHMNRLNQLVNNELYVRAAEFQKLASR